MKTKTKKAVTHKQLFLDKIEKLIKGYHIIGLESVKLDPRTRDQYIFNCAKEYSTLIGIPSRDASEACWVRVRQLAELKRTASLIHGIYFKPSNIQNGTRFACRIQSIKYSIPEIKEW